jgi:hypothetical protein
MYFDRWGYSLGLFLYRIFTPFKINSITWVLSIWQTSCTQHDKSCFPFLAKYSFQSNFLSALTMASSTRDYWVCVRCPFLQNTRWWAKFRDSVIPNIIVKFHSVSVTVIKKENTVSFYMLVSFERLYMYHVSAHCATPRQRLVPETQESHLTVWGRLKRTAISILHSSTFNTGTSKAKQRVADNTYHHNLGETIRSHVITKDYSLLGYVAA